MAETQARGEEAKAHSAAEGEKTAREAETEQRRRAEENERQALASAAEAKAVLEFFQNKVLAAGRPEGEEGGLGKDVTLRKAVEAAEPGVAAAFQDQPQVEASIRNVLGETFHYLGEPALAIPQVERARALREARLGPDHPDTLGSMNGLANLYLTAGKLDQALLLHEETLKLKKGQARAGTPQHAQVHRQPRHRVFGDRKAGFSAALI